jgi:hypothetical protein
VSRQQPPPTRRETHKSTIITFLKSNFNLQS